MSQYTKKKCFILLNTEPYHSTSTGVEAELYTFTTDILPGIEFGVYKQGSICEVYETRTGQRANLCGLKSSSIKGAIEEFKTSLLECEHIGADIVKSINNKPDAKNQLKLEQKYFELVEEFTNLTNIKLPVSRFYGVDVVGLDKIVSPPDGVSLSHQLVKKFGQRANDIVEELISKPWW